MKKISFWIIFLMLLIMACAGQEMSDETNEPSTTGLDFYKGADLSYVNEMEDCGAVYRNELNEVQDPFEIFADAGTNLVRVRLWHNPSWTSYSNYDDVKKTIARAKGYGMQVLLDFHYSDTWADPGRQEIPAAWISYLDDTVALGNAMYQYTFEVLNNLSEEGLLPEMVQIGNEINAMILQQGDVKWPIDWGRNSYLINQGIRAVRAIEIAKNKNVDVLLHIAQPENALWWFKDAVASGVMDFEWIGLSYYPQWSDYDLDNISMPLQTLIQTYKKRLMVVETAYPFTLEAKDSAHNIMGDSSLIEGYPATQSGQLNYLKKLKEAIETAGGEGLIYWEPAWVSTNCATQWGEGSHWENATLFDFDNKANLGMQF
ncbi:glycosyl hydrolase 53 family protein [Seonamhaeicola sp.]|uniref:glycoside hydrolase family 53 protein n=1 Tax=Seonamhaeicola sp. TaxID=1912245 RepID=UPI00261DD36A|nr:glycosyl hydrolase 53 family protein [Seonamhaeicola sp.]